MSQTDSAVVLVVDVEPENCRVLACQLAAEGFGVVTAHSGSEALQRLREGGIGAVLMDVVMPGLDGLEVTRQIQQDAALRTIPVIVTGLSSDASFRLRALSAGAADFLARPVDRAEMAVRLRNLLGLRAASRELAVRNAALSQCLSEQSVRTAYFEGMLRSAVDALTAQIAVLDASGSVVLVNEAWRQHMRERGHAFALGQPYRAELVAVEEDAGRVQAGVLGVVHGQAQQYACEYRSGTPERPRWFTLRVTRGKGAQASFCVAFHEDVTAERHARAALGETTAALKESRQHVQQAQRMESVGRLIGGVAHDFNNMLTSIICFTRFVVDDMAPEDPRRADLVESLKAADNAARLSNQLLVFSRRKPVQPLVLDVNAAISGIGRVLRRTLGERIELVILPAEEPLPVVFDPGQFDQLIFNLAVNARDAMPDGGTISIRVARVCLAHEGALAVGDYVELMVSDTGPGMSEEVAARAFEPALRSMGQRGAGLGLATCEGIVEQAGGQISVHSEPGGGTSFRVLLPCASDSRARDASKSLLQLPAALQGTVLVVEDQPAILRTMSRALAAAGMEVFEAGSGEDALALLSNRQPPLALVVTDIMLPGMSGQRLVGRLREHREDLPVLYVSGYLGEESSQSVRVDEHTAFVPKPFTGRQLVVQAAALLERRTYFVGTTPGSAGETPEV